MIAIIPNVFLCLRNGSVVGDLRLFFFFFLLNFNVRINEKMHKKFQNLRIDFKGKPIIIIYDPKRGVTMRKSDLACANRAFLSPKIYSLPLILFL